MTILQLFVILLMSGSEFALIFDFWKNRHNHHHPEKLGHGITLLVPFRTDHGVRERAWNWLSRYWAYALPGAQIIIGENDETPFCKTAAVNHAFRKAKGDIIVILDADCYIDASVILECAERIRAARDDHRKLWFIPYRHFYRLNETATFAVLASDPASPLRYPSPPPPGVLDSSKGASSGHWFGALIQVMPREAFIVAGGMDERFHGWGGEDIAFMRAVDTLYAKHKTTKNQVLHLWHPTIKGEVKDTRMWSGQKNMTENGKLAGKYHSAFGDRQKMWDLVTGADEDEADSE